MNNFSEENEEKDEYDDGIDFAEPLDTRYVTFGLIILVLSLLTLAFSDNFWLKCPAVVFLLSSFFIMVKKAPTK